MKKIIILFFLASCSFPYPTSKEKGLDKLIIGWWERYYPGDMVSEHASVLTHIEFMSDGECRFNMVHFDESSSFNGTYNNLGWEIDSVMPSLVLIKSFPGSFHPDFSISIIKIEKHQLIFKLNFEEYTETVYMKRIGS